MGRITGFWPYAHVADVARSIDFYARLGLVVRSTHEQDGRTVWAFLTDAAEPAKPAAGVMLAEADGPVDPHLQGVLFYLWCDDVAALREELLASGVAVPEVSYPFYMPAGELRVVDPDGYVLLVGRLSGDPS